MPVPPGPRGRVLGVWLAAMLVVAGAGCSAADGSVAATDPGTSSPATSPVPSEPQPSASGRTERLCERFDAAVEDGDDEERDEVVARMASGDDPRPESHESFFGADRKLWLWANLALRSQGVGDRASFALALSNILERCAAVA